MRQVRISYGLSVLPTWESNAYRGGSVRQPHEEGHVLVGHPDADLTWDEAGDSLEAELFARALRSSVSKGEPANGVALSAARRSTRVRSLRRGLVLADACGFAVAFAGVQAFVSNFQPGDLRISAIFVAALVMWLGLTQAYGLYDRDEVDVARSAVDDLPGILALSSIATLSGLFLVNGAGLAHPKLQVAAAFWLLSIAFVTLARALARSLVKQVLAPTEPILIVGTGTVARRVAEKLTSRPEYGLEVVGFMDDDPLELPEDAPPYLGEQRRLEQVVRAYGIERVIVAFSTATAASHVELLKRCAELNVRVDIVPRLFEVIGLRSVVHNVAGIPLLSIKPPRLSGPQHALKRSMDIIVSSLTLIVLSPLFAYAALRIKVESKGPVFFRQERMGAGGKPFRIYKFRSMYLDADERKRDLEHLNKHREDGPRMFKVPDDPRITRFGRFLRAWSLDELPQLLNVLKGEMSLVGPRPLILIEDENIVGHHRRRLNITPGLTGIWQVLGRSDIPFSEMVGLDYLYATNWSLWGDVKLLFHTVPAVLRRRGAY